MSKNSKSKFAERLRSLMEYKDITQKELANYAQVSRQSISKYANGETCPNSDQLKAIAEYLNVSADYLLGIANEKAIGTMPLDDTEYYILERALLIFSFACSTHSKFPSRETERNVKLAKYDVIAAIQGITREIGKENGLEIEY